MNKSKMKIDSYGTKIWRNPQDEYHNEEGPAVILTNDTKAWFINGKTHRENGPAVIHSDGEKRWSIDDKRIV